MSLHTRNEDKTLGKTPCKTERETWQCPNMKRVENDRDMSGDNYYCTMCRKHIWLDYDEMR